ncbi:MAG: tetratricopeptide repeat protein, partial [Bacteroidota bacterium]
FKKSLAHFEKLGDLSRQATILSNMGIVHNDRGDYEQALGYYHQSLTLQDSADNPLGMARALGNIGLVYNYQGNYPQALDHYERSNALFASIDDDLGQAINWSNAATIYFAQKDYPQALAYHERSLAVLRRLENKRAMGKTLNNMADVYAEQGDLEQALSYYEQSMALHEALEDQNNIAWVEKNIGDIYRKQGKTDEALAQYQLSLDMWESLQDQRGMAEAATSIGRWYQAVGEYGKARYFGEKALPLAQESGAAQDIRNVAQLLYQTYKATNQAPQALVMHELYLEMRDSLNSEDNQRAAIRYQFAQQALADSLVNEQAKALAAQAYESELSQQRIGLGFAAGIGLLLSILAFVLYRNNQSRKQTNQLLSTQNEEIEAKSQQNELLLKEIHHRVKNNLQTISSLLYLQSAHIQDADIKQAVAAGRHRVESMALIHQKLYQRENLAAIEMKDYLTNLSRSLLQTFGYQPERIQLQMDMEEIELDVDTAIPIGLIVNELITNSLKYAFPNERQGSIHISLSKHPDEKLELQVADDGVGSANGESGTSFGSQLIQLLTVQLGGSLEQGGEKGYWTKIVV